MPEQINQSSLAAKSASLDAKDSLKVKIATQDVNDNYVHDINKWKATLANPGASDEDRAKIAAAKKILLFVGAGGLQVNGSIIKDGKTTQATALGAENKVPVSAYLSGHMGRIYSSLPTGQSKAVLSWLNNNRDKDGKVVKSVVNRRGFATHDAAVEKVIGAKGKAGTKIIEKKLTPLKALFKGISSKTHYGLNIGMGGVGQKYQSDPTKVISNDGTSGHVYLNVGSGKEGDFIGVGLEGTAPGKSNHLGSHSLVGAADEFTALESTKLAIKNTPKNILKALNNSKISGQKIEEADEKTIKTYCNYHKKPAIARLFSKKPDKNQYLQACENVGIKFTDENMILTETGKKQAEAGIVVMKNYNGLTMNLESGNLDKIINTDLENIPDEIIHFKPQASFDRFMSQKEIYKNMDKRPALYNNPQLNHETCAAIGVMYNSLETIDNNKEPKLNAGIESILALLADKKRFNEVFNEKGMNIDNFDILNQEHANLMTSKFPAHKAVVDKMQQVAAQEKVNMMQGIVSDYTGLESATKTQGVAINPMELRAPNQGQKIDPTIVAQKMQKKFTSVSFPPTKVRSVSRPTVITAKPTRAGREGRG